MNSDTTLFFATTEARALDIKMHGFTDSSPVINIHTRASAAREVTQEPGVILHQRPVIADDLFDGDGIINIRPEDQFFVTVAVAKDALHLTQRVVGLGIPGDHYFAKAAFWNNCPPPEISPVALGIVMRLNRFTTEQLVDFARVIERRIESGVRVAFSQQVEHWRLAVLKTRE